MENRILNRVLKKLETPGIMNALLKLSNPDLHSFLLELFNHKSRQIQPAQLLHSYQQNPYVKPYPPGFASGL